MDKETFLKIVDNISLYAITNFYIAYEDENGNEYNIQFKEE